LLFILVNVVLFIRPAEIYPELLGFPIYEAVILSCLAVSLPSLIQMFRARPLINQPITVCVLALLPAVFLSHLSHLNLYSARWGAYDFLKLIIYYLLLVANVNSRARLRHFLLCLAILVGVMTTLAVLQYHGLINIPALARLEVKAVIEATGQEIYTSRLRSTGIFNDPNDLCLILIMGIGICSYWLGDRRSGLTRVLALVLLGLFAYALRLTHSRGGFIALLAGMGTFSLIRFGWKKATFLAVAVLPLAFVIFGGRQTEFNLADTEDTGQQRFQLWREGIALFKKSPVFGIGRDEFVENAQFVAHNSFLHCFTELGIFGGLLFLGAFLCSLWMLKRLASPHIKIVDPELKCLHPYMTAMAAAYTVGLLFLSRAYVVNTYLILGLMSAYCRVTPVYPAIPILRFDGRLIRRLVWCGIAFMASIYLIARFFVR
jgi:O-antigen ligase